MKTILLSGMLSLAIVASINLFSQKSHTSELTSIQLANIEALADNETPVEVVKCYCKINLFGSNVCTANGSGGYCGGDPCSNHDGNCR